MCTLYSVGGGTGLRPIFCLREGEVGMCEMRLEYVIFQDWERVKMRS